MPLAGLTAFGFKGSGGGGLKGHFYDLKQTADRKPTDIKSDGMYDAHHNFTGSMLAHLKLMDEFFASNWDEKILQRYYQAKDTMVTYQVFIPAMTASKAPEAFAVEKEVKPSHWIIHYKGTVTAPKDGDIRFLGAADDTLAVRFNGQNALLANLQQQMQSVPLFTDKTTIQANKETGFSTGKWIQVERGKSYPIEILVSELPGGSFFAWLMIEERQPEKPYPKRTFAPFAEKKAYPVFQTKKGIPVPPYEKPNMTPPANALPNWKPRESVPEVAPDPVVFPGK